MNEASINQTKKPTRAANVTLYESDRRALAPKASMLKRC